MAMDQVQIVMAKRKLNWSESELLALSDEVVKLFDQGNLTIVYILPQNRNK
jgi:hypothetical protein